MNADEAIQILDGLIGEEFLSQLENEALNHAIEHMKRWQWQNIEKSKPNVEFYYLCEGEAGCYSAPIICFYFKKFGFIDNDGLEFDAKKWMPLPELSQPFVEKDGAPYIPLPDAPEVKE